MGSIHSFGMKDHTDSLRIVDRLQGCVNWLPKGDGRSLHYCLHCCPAYSRGDDC